MRFLLICLVALFTAAPLQAHQQKAAFTQVLLNERSGLLEISHRFLLHDAEHAVKQLFDNRADIIANPATQQRFADYVVSRFAIVDDVGEALAMSFVGVEIDRSFIWVYQQSSPPKTQRLTITHKALLDLWPGQENMVNVEGLGELKTLFLESHQQSATIAVE